MKRVPHYWSLFNTLTLLNMMFERAITFNRKKQFPTPLKFISLGYSSSGKSYHLGSLYSLRNNPGPHRFSIRGEDIVNMNRIEDIYRTLTNKKAGVVMSTTKMDTARIVFQKRRTDLFNIHLTDIFGQSTEVGRNADETQKLVDRLPENHGVIIFIKVPTNFDEYYEALDQLNRLLDLASIILNKNQFIPVALVLTQIDKLSSLSSISDEIENEVLKYRDIYANDADMFEQKIKFALKDVINLKVADEVESIFIKKLVQHFYDQFAGSYTARRAFPSTSLGFNNSRINPNDEKQATEVAIENQLYPYGTTASLLWMIWAVSELYPKYSLSENFNKDELFEELRNLYLTGQAFEGFSRVWSINNLKDLYL